MQGKRAIPELVFDIGLNNGDDAAYYLHLGYRVVGVEANPLLAAQCSERFEREIRAGEIKIVNVGILREAGEFTFWSSLQNAGWSTFAADKNGMPGEWQEMKVSCITARQLIADYGEPFFIKVDIEGADFQILETLSPTIAPPYISLEMNWNDPFLERLIELGYSAFKFIDGETFRPTPPIFDHQVGWRLLRKAGRTVPGVGAIMRSLPQSLRPKQEWNPPGKYSPDGYEFPFYSSGPFGEQAAGSWLTPKAATRWLKQLKDDYQKVGRPSTLWWDIHARHSSVQK